MVSSSSKSFEGLRIYVNYFGWHCIGVLVNFLDTLPPIVCSGENHALHTRLFQGNFASLFEVLGRCSAVAPGAAGRRTPGIQIREAAPHSPVPHNIYYVTAYGPAVRLFFYSIPEIDHS